MKSVQKVQIEQTSKTLKGWYLVSQAMFWIPIVWIIWGDTSNETLGHCMALSFVGSFILGAGVKSATWWEHG